MARPKAFNRQQAQAQALRLFWRKGYNATSIEDLVETLHLSRSSLYDTFGDKRTLFLDGLKLYSKTVLSHVGQVLDEAESPINGIRKLLEELIAGVGSESGDMGCFMVNSIAELAPYDANVTEIAKAYSKDFEGLLAGAIGEMPPKAQTPDQLAAYVFNVMQGTRILIKSGATYEQLQAIAEITLNSLQ